MRRVYTCICERLIANSTIDERSDCWLWVGKLNNRYGRINLYIGGRTLARWAHRVAYEAWRGAIPKGFAIDHLCHNTACINPAHLRIVSAAENSKESQRRNPRGGNKRRKT